MRFITFITTALIAISAMAQQEYQLKVADFNELKVIDGVSVDWICNADSAGMIVFNTTPEKASVISFSAKKSRLEVRLNDIDRKNPPAELPVVCVYSSKVKKVENSGDSLVRIVNPVLSQEEFSAKVIGNGRISCHNVEAKAELKASIVTGKGQLILSGSAPKASYTVTGTGTIQADNVKAEEVTAKIVGTGTIGCTASDLLSIYGMGTGKVYYAGNPKEIASKSVGISAIRIE